MSDRGGRDSQEVTADLDNKVSRSADSKTGKGVESGAETVNVSGSPPVTADKYRVLNDFYETRRKGGDSSQKNQNKDRGKADRQGQSEKRAEGKDYSQQIIYAASLVSSKMAGANEDGNVAIDGVVSAINSVSKSKDVIETARAIKQAIQKKIVDSQIAKSLEIPAADSLPPDQRKQHKKQVRKAVRLKKKIKKGKYDSEYLKAIVAKKGSISVDDLKDIKKAKVKPKQNYVVNKAVNRVVSEIHKINVDQNVGIEATARSVETSVSTYRAVHTTSNVVKGTARRAANVARYAKSFKGKGARKGLKKLGKDAISFIKAFVSTAFKSVAKTAAGTLLPIALLILLVFLLLNTLGPGLAVMTGELSVYPTEAEELTSVSTSFGELADAKHEEIDTIETSPQWSYIDEFDYNPSKAEMLELVYEYDLYIIMGYLAAKYQDFSIADVMPEIQSIYSDMFQLIYDVETQVRYRTNSAGERESYNYYILHITLKTKTAQEVVEPLISSSEMQELYDTYTDDALAGSQQAILNPFKTDWRGRISSRYGSRTYKMDGELVSDVHTGLDMRYPVGTPVFAGVTGKVTSVVHGSTGFGYHVRIQNGNGDIEVLYAHLSYIDIAMGDIVIGGVTKIGEVGTTGWSNGPHLHIEVVLSGVRHDPLYFVGYATNPND